MTLHRFVAFCSLATLCWWNSGCLHAPQTELPQPLLTIPKDWTAHTLSSPPPSDHWWQDFRFDQLDGWIQEALANNPSLHAAAARVQQAKEIAIQSGAAKVPIANLNSNASRTQFNSFGRSGRINSHQVTVDLTWELDLWGAIASQELASLEEVAAQQAAYEGVRLSLIASIVRASIQLTEAQQQLSIFKNSSQQIEQVVERLRQRYQRGLRSALAVRLTEADLAATLADIASRQMALDSSRRQLEILLGRYPSGKIHSLATLNSPPTLPSILPAELLRRRPDLAQASALLRASELRAEVAQLDLLPRLTLGASAGSSVEQLSNLFGPDFGIWNIVGGLTQPIFEGGRLRAEARRNLAAYDQSLAEYYDTMLLAYVEVEESIAAADWLKQRNHHLQISTKESRQALELSQERYFTGLIDIIDLLEARRRYFASLSSTVANQRQQQLNHVRLIVAMGGGYRQPTAPSAKSPAVIPLPSAQEQP